jgi:hypothetical protein
MRAATVFIIGMLVMPNYGLMGQRAKAEPLGVLQRAAPSNRLPDPTGLAGLKARFFSGEITREQFDEEVGRLLPENPYPNEPPALPRRKTKS